MFVLTDGVPVCIAWVCWLLVLHVCVATMCWLLVSLFCASCLCWQLELPVCGLCCLSVLAVSCISCLCWLMVYLPVLFVFIGPLCCLSVVLVCVDCRGYLLVLLVSLDCQSCLIVLLVCVDCGCNLSLLHVCVDCWSCLFVLPVCAVCLCWLFLVNGVYVDWWCVCLCFLGVLTVCVACLCCFSVLTASVAFLCCLHALTVGVACLCCLLITNTIKISYTLFTVHHIVLCGVQVPLSHPAFHHLCLLDCVHSSCLRHLPSSLLRSVVCSVRRAQTLLHVLQTPPFHLETRAVLAQANALFLPFYKDPVIIFKDLFWSSDFIPKSLSYPFICFCLYECFASTIKSI